MTLHTQTTGSGRPLVLLHGWGLHGGVWNGILPALEKHYRCVALDLPGHGESPVVDGGLDEWTAACLDVAPAGAVWLGWSLGGMIALNAALQARNDLAGLLLVSTTPRFLTAPDWPHAVAPATLAKFGDGLASDWRRTVEDFLVLQTLGASGGKQALKSLRREVFSCRAPDPAGLTTGLAILDQIDLRARLDEITIPAKVMNGALDRLTPPGAGRALADALNGDFTEVAHAAHTPFLSNPEQFIQWAGDYAA